MFKNGILSIVLTTLLICGFVPHIDAATFTLNSITIIDFNEGGGDNALDILTNNSAYVPYATTPNLLVGQSVTFDLFDIWTEEDQVTPGEDDIVKPITVDFNFLGATGGPIAGVTEGSVTIYGDVIYEAELFGTTYQYTITDWLHDEGQVSWNSSADFTFGNGGIFNVTLSPTSFSQGVPSTVEGQNGEWSSLANSVGLINESTVQATLLYVQAPTAVPVPPAIILLGTGILGIAGIRRKYKK